MWRLQALCSVIVGFLFVVSLGLEVVAEVEQAAEHNQDYPMWGGTSARVNAPQGRGIALDWNCSDVHWLTDGEQPSFSGLRPPGSTNVKWAVRLGSQTYGNPVVADGKVFVGTNNGAGYLKRYPSRVDLGVLLCFDEESGDFLWQDSNPKLATGRVHDWPLQGVCSTPIVKGDRLWYVNNRGQVVCLDTRGFYDDEDDGPEQGNWVPVFNLPTTLRAQLRKLRSVPPQLKEFFSSEGLPLPTDCYPQRKDDYTFLLRTLQGKPGIQHPQRQTIYQLKFEGGLLLVFKAREDVESPAAEPLFVLADDPLHASLDQHTLSESLLDTFKGVGIELSEHYRLNTIQPGLSWSLVDQKKDTSDKTYRLRLEGQQTLCAEMLVTSAHKNEADVVWKLDMMKELGVSQHNMSNCSPLLVDNRLFVCTSNGLDESHINIPSPDAPSFLALAGDTGKVLWSFTVPGKNILHAQWASPSYGVFRNQPQVIFPGGDGWVYSFDPAGDGKGEAKLLWKFDGNPKTSEWVLGGRGTRNNIIAFPAIYDDLVYITMGQDPEHGEGEGRLWCLDPARHMDGDDVSAELAVDFEGNIIPHRRIKAVDPALGERAIPNPDSAVVWSYSNFDQNRDGEIDFEEEFHRSLGIPAIRDDILYIADFSGLFHCLDAKSGKVHWVHDLFAQCWGSALVVDGKVYIGDEDGEVAVFRHSSDPHVAMEDGEPIRIIDMGNAIYMTPIVANNVLYIANKNSLFAIATED